jgi:large subunit ribosomal protein L6
MSRIGKRPIEIPAGVEIMLQDRLLTGKGKNGEFGFKVHDSVNVEIAEGKIAFKPRNDGKEARSMWGTCSAVVSNAVRGLVQDFVKKVSLVGVGYKASVQARNLVMQLGYSHDIVFEIPVGIKIICESPTVVVISGADRQKVGEVAKRLQRFRAPEPYKGKGIIAEGQYVYRKEGKKK